MSATTLKHRSLPEHDKAQVDDMLASLADDAGLDDAEWWCFADITCGTLMFDPLTLRNIHMDVEDAEPCYFEKWEVHRANLLSKFARLDSLSRLAVAIRCRSLFDD